MQRKPLVIKRILGNGYIRCSRYPPHGRRWNMRREINRKLGKRSRTATYGAQREEDRASSTRPTVEAVKKKEGEDSQEGVSAMHECDDYMTNDEIYDARKGGGASLAESEYKANPRSQETAFP